MDRTALPVLQRSFGLDDVAAEPGRATGPDAGDRGPGRATPRGGDPGAARPGRARAAGSPAWSAGSTWPARTSPGRWPRRARDRAAGRWWRCATSCRWSRTPAGCAGRGPATACGRGRGRAGLRPRVSPAPAAAGHRDASPRCRRSGSCSITRASRRSRPVTCGLAGGPRALAALPNVAVKLSGLVTEADWDSWTPGQLAPVIESRAGPVRPGADDVRLGLAGLPAGGQLRRGGGGGHAGAGPPESPRSARRSAAARPAPGTGSDADAREDAMKQTRSARHGRGDRAGLRRRLGREPLHRDHRRGGPAAVDTAPGRAGPLLRHRAALRAGPVRARLGAALRHRPREVFVVRRKWAGCWSPIRGRGFRPGRGRLRGAGHLRRRFDFSAAACAAAWRAAWAARARRADLVYVHDPDDHVDEAITGAIPR